MLITPEYREQNKKLHEGGDYGGSSGKWAPTVCTIANSNGCSSILDYGCGKGDLKEALRYSPHVREYDPAIEGKDAAPEPADLVVCTDVLEHIEPELIDNVLADLKRCTLKIGYFTICTIPALKTLPDGRNAHILLRDPVWWFNKLSESFAVQYMKVQGGDLIFVVTPK